MIGDGDHMSHWCFGSGIVKNSDPEKHQVPVEWEHDYTSVILVEFSVAPSTQKLHRAWVLREDCDLVSQR